MEAAAKAKAEERRLAVEAKKTVKHFAAALAALSLVVGPQAKEQLARDLKIMEDKMLHGQAMSSAQQEEAVRSMMPRVYGMVCAESIWVFRLCCVCGVR